MAQRRENFFKTVSASCWNLTGLMPVIPKKPVMVQHCKDSFEKSFGSVVARCSNLTGLILELSRYGAASQRLFRENF
jgi:hypothetical protein